LFGFSVKPNNLALAKNVKLTILSWAAIDLCDVLYVRMACAKSIRQARVEVRREDCPDQATHHQLS
jgi:hypothetical protein